jgi:hypothetical protein
MADFTKLSDLVNNYFTVEKVWGYKFKKWNDEAKKMEVSDTWQKDYRKVWEVDTDHGKLDLSQAQMGTLLEAVSKQGKSDITERTFGVKSNGKTGMDIRYFFNVSGEAPKDRTPLPEPEVINVDELPF